MLPDLDWLKLAKVKSNCAQFARLSQEYPVDFIPVIGLRRAVSQHITRRMLMQLELGAGRQPTPGFIHHDKRKHSPDIDVAHDLDLLPWPWDDNTCDEILALDVFEHLQIMPEAWMRECHRMLRPGRILRLRVPIFGSPWHLWDPTHVRGFHPANFQYFLRGHEHWLKYGSYYFEFAYSSGVIEIEQFNIVATLTK